MTDTPIQILSAGLLLGLSAGISPGPLLTLVLTQTLKHSKTDGIKVAISPLFTDIPIIIVAFLIYDQLSEYSFILASIAFLGGLFVAFLGIESIRTKELSTEINTREAQSIRKGIITNALSPHPYIFWATVGIPLLFKAYALSLQTACLFLLTFYALLIGSKVIIAIIIARSKSLFNQKVYLITMKVLGFILIVFAILIFYDGYNLYTQS